MGEIAPRPGLAARTIRELGVGNPSRRLPPDVIEPATRILERTIRRHRRSLNANAAERRKAWVADMLCIFKLLASRRLREQHDINSLRLALWDDQQTINALSYHAHLTASRCVINRTFLIDLSLALFKWSNEFEVRFLERNEKSPAQVYPPNDPLALCSPRDTRAKDTRTARRIEEFRRRMELLGERPVEKNDMSIYLGYRDTTMLHRVSREANNSSEAASAAVERMLQCPSPKEFWSVVDKRRNSKVLLK